MKSNEIDIHKELKKYFGFNQFKGLQEQVIRSLIAGKNTFVIMPTGGGKSLCYQLPALMKEGTAIIVSPLIALMKNQVDAIRSLSSENGIAHVLNSSLNKTEINQVKKDITSGLTKLLYVAPESLAKEEYLKFLKNINISFVAIDEAHCISEWGHDFRPEYRNLKNSIKLLGNAPVIGLTATATPKVQEDILKNLEMADANTFKASFNRPNLFYEVRTKTKNIESDIIRFIKQNKGKSGIIYCLSRKKVESIAQVLQVNNISAVPYHAGLDAKTRAKHQDMFLMEDVEVVVATIAFGMGIDKPDVRFVIHHDIPKSLESYYQETGRGGRDGGEGHCLAYYSYKDVEKLEKFLSGKPVAEQEIGFALLQEVVAYAETSMSRRKFLLHYFGEEFDTETGEGGDMDDNVRNPKNKIEAKDQVIQLLEMVRDTKHLYKSKEIVFALTGKVNAMIKAHKTDTQPFFGCGSDFEERYWMALLRQVLVDGLLSKDIETYGIIKITDSGLDFIKNPISFMMSEDHEYNETEDEAIVTAAKSSGVADETLMVILRDLRKKVAKKLGVPPFVVFQDPSLEEMATVYPTTKEELSQINGVGMGKVEKFGTSFLQVIQNYVAENELETASEVLIKTSGTRSKVKISIIQQIDRKIKLEEIAQNLNLSLIDLLQEIEQITYSGTKLNIDYYIHRIMDEDREDILLDYFMSAETDHIKAALDELEGEDFTEEELRVYRIKFISEHAN